MQMSYRSTKTADRELTQLAQSQAGYFTAKQAAKLGYDYSHLAYHLKVGNFERVGHGLYRLPEIPLSEHDELVRLTLWSRNREDQPQAVASHQTALVLHELTELLPSSIHLTVPAGFRKTPDRGVVLYQGEVSKKDAQQREGFSVTRPLRTLIDLAEDESFSDEHLLKAVWRAVEDGVVQKSKLIATAKLSPAYSRLSPIIAHMP